MATERPSILALEGRFDRRELEEYCGRLGLPTPETVEMAVDLDLPEVGQERDGDIETMLDVHVVAASASGARIGVCRASNTAQGFVNGLARMIYDGQLDASVCSVSYGDYAATWSIQARKAIGSLLEDAALLGITVCCASGNLRSSDGAPDPESKHVDFPAEHPLALGCGGTRLGPELDQHQPGLLKEVVWDDGQMGSGGGESEKFDKPAWQQGEGLEGLTKRGIPDAAGNADPRTGYAIRIRERDGMVVGGTSAVAPLWAGLIARINQRLGRRVGPLGPLLYEIDARAFHDIEHGNNGAWHAGKGWDACTGRGRPKGNALLEELSRKLGASAEP
jgi:kumamolisin